MKTLLAFALALGLTYGCEPASEDGDRTSGNNALPSSMTNNQDTSTAQTYTPPPSGLPDEGTPEPGLARAASAVVTAEVVEVTLDTIFEQGPNDPADSAKVEITALDRAEDPQSVLRLSVGQELTLRLRYSARPAKLRRILEGTETTQGNTVSYTPPKEGGIGLEGEYYIYHLLAGYGAEETVLPGLNKGDRISFTVSEVDLLGQQGTAEVGEYQVLPTSD